MARKIIWTERSRNDRIAIFSFWNERNQSFNYSKRLNSLIKESLKLICKYPAIGKLTKKENVRLKILKEYLIIYEITEREIVVLSLWDCRQNPEDLKSIIS